MGDLRDSLERIRAIPAKWKHLADPVGELKRIRQDPDYSPWENPQWTVPFTKCCESCNCKIPAPK